MTKVIPNRQKELAERLLEYTPFFLAIILWCILSFKEQFFLKKVEDLSVFLFDKQFLLESTRIPGGILGLVGAFLTQFLHLPWLGALIWVALLLLAYLLTIRALRISASLAPLALIPVTLLVIGNMSLGYDLFIMRDQEHFFSPVLGYIATLVPIIVTYRLKALPGKLVFIASWTIAGFAVLGAYAFTGVITAACAELTRKDVLRKDRITLFLGSLALVIIVPLVIYSFYTTYRLVDSWTVGLPSVSEDVLTKAMRTPFQLALLCPILFVLAHPKYTSISLSPDRKIIVHSVTYIFAVAIAWGFWFKDENYHTELAMSAAVDRYDWNEVVDIFSKTAARHSKSDAKAYESRTKKIADASSSEEISDIVDRFAKRFFEPTRTMVLYRDLALLKTNRALDQAFTLKDGGRQQKSSLQIPMAWQSGKQFYFQYGLVNMAYRWCLEDAVEHNWSYGTLKYMAMHAIIMQEAELAEKYLNKLEKTIFYRGWARSQRKLKSDEAAMSATEPYKSILPYMCFENRMTNDAVKTEAFIINHFLNPEPPHPTPEYDRAALFFAMRIQNIPMFRERLYYYLQTNKVNTLPRAVQEASLLYSNLEKDDSQLPYDNSIRQSYEAFNKFVQNHPIRSMKESDYIYSQKFGKTFFYYYYFVRNLQTY